MAKPVKNTTDKERKSKKRIKVHHSCLELYTESKLVDKYDIEGDYSSRSDRENSTFGATEEDLDNPNFWINL